MSEVKKPYPLDVEAALDENNPYLADRIMAMYRRAKELKALCIGEKMGVGGFFAELFFDDALQGLKNDDLHERLIRTMGEVLPIEAGTAFLLEWVFGLAMQERKISEISGDPELSGVSETADGVHDVLGKK